jgi:hypothetical protein
MFSQGHHAPYRHLDGDAGQSVTGISPAGGEKWGPATNRCLPMCAGSPQSASPRCVRFPLRRFGANEKRQREVDQHSGRLHKTVDAATHPHGSAQTRHLRLSIWAILAFASMEVVRISLKEDFS